MGSSPTRGSSFFLGKVTALGVLCCFALLFARPRLSLKHVCIFVVQMAEVSKELKITGGKADGWMLY